MKHIYDLPEEFDFFNLFELAGQECGIIIERAECGDDLVDVVCWAAHDIQLPEGAVITEHGRVDDVRDLLPGSIAYRNEDDDQPAGHPHYYSDRNIYVDGMEISRDEFDDLPALFGIRTKHNEHVVFEHDENGSLIPTGGEYWEIGDIIVVAPDGWN